jgi:anti-sigma B factor antagonist
VDRTANQLTVDGCVICRPVGDLDALTVRGLRGLLAEAVSAPRLIIDISAVTFIDSAGLGALIGGIRRTRELGGRVVVVCNRPGICRVLHSTGFDAIVTVTESVEEATIRLQCSTEAGTLASDPHRSRSATQHL